MASIEDRSKIVVSVPRRPGLTKTIRFNEKRLVRDYVQELKASGHAPDVDSEKDSYALRIRRKGAKHQTLFFKSLEAAAVALKQFEAAEATGLFLDYSEGQRTTLADLLIRYLREQAPKHRGFVVEYYIVSALLADAGLPRIDMAEVLAQHPGPHPSLEGLHCPKATGRTRRKTAPMARFILKPFAHVTPSDIEDYIYERLDCVEPATVDREIDILTAVCNIAIEKWRIHVALSPMSGVERPKYYNERDRRLRGDEEQRLLDAAAEEDARLCQAQALKGLMTGARADASQRATVYARKTVISRALAALKPEAQACYVHVPLLETFVQYQLMTGARRSEALRQKWSDIDFDGRSAFIPESKNGRPRKLALRADLIELLKLLPRDDERVFPLSEDALRKSWERICQAAKLTGADALRVHDLRHEAISRVAEAGAKLPGGFSLLDLQAFSGHRDLRMLTRYTHLCTRALAHRLDQGFDGVKVRKGRTRAKHSVIAESTVDGTNQASGELTAPVPREQATPEVDASGVTSSGASAFAQVPPLGGGGASIRVTLSQSGARVFQIAKRTAAQPAPGGPGS